MQPGRGWIDGLHLYLPGSDPVTLEAPYFPPPIHDPAVDATSIAAGVRDAVILEVWEEAFNAFQIRIPDEGPPEEYLLEPALGGPDTTERVRLNYGLKLLRLAPDEDCGNIADRLREDSENRGHLTVTPAPAIAIAGECPVQAGGGYTGFEHFLYRIEVEVPTAAGEARFKWSRFNGGLVGRGTYDNGTDEVTVRANEPMINLSGLTNFWIEVIAHDPNFGHWRTFMRADAALVADGLLQLANIEGAWPVAAGGEAFFRLWDGTELISDFPTGLAAPNELEQGIRLEFDAPLPNNANYRPSDFWTFLVRAAGVDFDPAVWPDDEEPHGVLYHRAPLAVLNWDGGPVANLNGPPEIHDCRNIFQPLTRQQTCCSYRVGDGLNSFGDFDSIQDAIDALPVDGGEICVLPGTYTENITVTRDNVHIHGCGDRTRVISGPPAGEFLAAEPVFTIPGRHHVRISSMAIQADPAGIGILVTTGPRGLLPSHHIRLDNLLVEAAAESAIFVRAAVEIEIRDCRIHMQDVRTEWPGLFLRADDALVEHNEIIVIPGIDPATGVGGFVAAGRGGMQIAGTSERIRVIDNLIEGGIGNGITLGTVVQIDPAGVPAGDDHGWVINLDDPCDPCGPGDTRIPPGDDPDDPRYESEGSIYDLRIERNRILDMGINGIGVVGFFDLDAEDEFITIVKLAILGNTITGCLLRDIADIPPEMIDYMGYGGISLADAEEVRIYDNAIEDNGPNHTFPVCGIFVLHGEGLDMCRNRILNNGAKTSDEPEDANPGARAGIRVVYAVPGIVPLTVLREIRPRQNGVPAIRVHDNVVSQPLGQALYMGALGPVTVEGNQLTSRGIVPDFSQASSWASTVLIFNFGLSNEFYLQTILFTGATADPLDIGVTPSATDEFIFSPRTGIDDAGFGQYMANGNVLFSDNQVVTDLLDREFSFAISSTLILTLDDVQVTDNQFDCNFMVDFLFTNLLVIGMTTRIMDNRMKETMFISLFSSVALGLIFNNCSNNQTTHCILNLDSPLNALSWLTTDIRENNNQILFNALSFFEGWCEQFGSFRKLMATEAIVQP
jgi:hypothetical protein